MSAQPTVYFIDDSATMREVIKIAFRRENIDVIACNDASSALELMEQGKPDVVITDVIMPGRDGYDVCQFIKQHPRLGQTPVILMSGVVNKAVAEKAFSVRADELIRKPFQPQDLITRVRHLISPREEAEMAAVANAPQASATATLSDIFSGPMPVRPPKMTRTLGPVPVPRTMIPRIPPPQVDVAGSARQVNVPGVQRSAPSVPPMPKMRAPEASAASSAVQPGTTSGRVPPPPSGAGMSDVAKLRLELLRLQSQVKKLESELAAEREYSNALEAHIKTLQTGQ